MTINPGPNGADHKPSELILFMGMKTKLFKHRTMAK
jgi:hypothetical protein